MIIDAHTHLSDKNTEEKTKQLLFAMDGAHVDKAALITTTDPDFSMETAIKVKTKYPNRFFVIGHVSPLSATQNDRDYLEKKLKLKQIKGIKFYPGYEYFYPNDKTLLSPYMRLAKKYDIPIIFHTGDTWSVNKKARLKYAHPLAIDDLAVDFPNNKIVIAHMGNPWIMDATMIIFKNKNVYGDISGWSYEPVDQSEEKKLMGIIRYLGKADKIMFGTDFGINTTPEFVKSHIDMIENLPISSSEKKKILGENAKKLFKV